jgi:uncharacterized protein (DUF983 family)
MGGIVRKGACVRKGFPYFGGMEDLTCPNCNVDTDATELKQNNLRCPTCGHDMSDLKEDDLPTDLDEDEDLEDEEEEEDEEK